MAAQKRQLLQIGIPLESHHTAAVFLRPHGQKRDRQVPVHIFGKPEGQALSGPQTILAGLKGLGLLRGDHAHIIPVVPQDQLSCVGGDLGRGQLIQGAGSQCGQPLRCQNGFVAVHHGGKQTGPGRPDGLYGVSSLRPQGFQLIFQFLQLPTEILGAGIGIIPLEDQRPQLLPPALRRVQPSRRHDGPVIQQGPGDLAVQLQRDLRAQHGFLSVFQLLDAVIQGFDLVLPVQGRLIGVDGGHGPAGADPLALVFPQPHKAAGIAGEHLLLPDHIAADVHRILHLIGVGQGGGKGVAYIAVDLIAEIGQHQKGDDRREQLAYKG